MNKRLLYLIIFCIIVMLTSIVLTFTYQKTDQNDQNNKKNEPTNIEMYPNSSAEEVYELIEDEIYISNFEVSYNEITQKWKLRLTIKNATDKDISLDDYLVLVYGKSGKILKEYYEGLNSKISAQAENKNIYILPFDGNLIEKVTIVKNSEYTYDPENYE